MIINFRYCSGKLNSGPLLLISLQPEHSSDGQSRLRDEDREIESPEDGKDSPQDEGRAEIRGHA
jgi:hypothetical protein